MHRSEGATALVGMEDFVVGARLDVDGELWLMVELQGRRPRSAEVRVRDLPIGDRRVVLVAQAAVALPGARLRGQDVVEETDAIAPRAVLTERARAEICRRVGRDGHGWPSWPGSSG